MKITRILLAQAIPGMIIAEDVFTKDDHLVIAKETPLTDRIITRLEFYSIEVISIYIYNDLQDVNEAFLETTYYDKIKHSESFHRFHLAYQNAVSEFKNSLDHIVLEKEEIDTDQLLTDVRQVLNQSDSSIELFNMLHCMRQYDDTTYIHSINVSLICNIIGKWLHFSPEDLESITLCGLLHDLGKLMIPSNIILKPAKLTEAEFTTVKTHTIRGYNLLKGKMIDSRIKDAALMHHERCDGTGYPYGFYSEQIDPYAKLVAIADVYDAMTCARVYRGPLCPFDVISIFESEGYSKYDAKYIMTFLEGIMQTYVNNSVILNNDMNGRIIMINKNDLSRPVVKVGTQFIDLRHHRDLHIVALV
ncbi:MAG: HD-GYP domain-containing protein [Mobilitalea sp.]